MTAVSPDASIAVLVAPNREPCQLVLPPGATIRVTSNTGRSADFHIRRGDERWIECDGTYELLSWETDPPTMADRFRAWVHRHICERR